MRWRRTISKNKQHRHNETGLRNMPEQENGPVGQDEADQADHDGKENSKVRHARKRLQKKKKSKKNKSARHEADNADNDDKEEKVDVEQEGKVEVEIEYVAPEDDSDKAAQAFADVFKQFLPPEELTAPKEADKGEEEKKPKEEQDEEQGEQGGDEGEGEGEGEKQLSNKARKRMNRLGIAELKQLVARPDIVEVWDTTAADPRTLVFLKSHRNAVPVPKHWCQKRKYLQGKRGIEKPPFQLPHFIADTGIQKMREALFEKDDDKRQKQKQRERMAPKMNKMDINYQVLHDAFFKYQTKPELTCHGDMYYEGKEFEVSLKAKRPGALSADLREALGMAEGQPPPWLFNMQRYGPPPSYPSLRIPAINAPLPADAEYGYGHGQWGKPPVDEEGRPLYGGNPFDPPGSEPTAYDASQRVERSRWGEMKADVSSDEEEEEEEAAPEVNEGEGLATPAGLDSVVSTVGMQTPESSVALRKAAGGKDTPASEAVQPQLFQVLPEQQASVGAAAFGSDKQYQVPTQPVSQLMKEKKKDTTERVQVSLNPEELENMDASILKQKYAEQIQAKQRGQLDDDDDEEDGPSHKRKGTYKGSDQPNKRQKEFRF